MLRTHYPQIPPRVEYSLTQLGTTLHPIFKTACDWTDKHMSEVRRARSRYDAQLAEQARVSA